MKYKDTVLLPLLSSFQEMYHLVSAIDGCQDIETQSLVTTGFLKQKHDDEFLQIWYEKKQEHTFYIQLATAKEIQPRTSLKSSYHTHSLET